MYQSDSPITNREEDLLGRADFAQRLAEVITRNTLSDTMCIGLHGKWGVGKTSIINMVIENIEEHPAENRPVIIRFEPWLFSSSEDLTKQFLMRLSSEFLHQDGMLNAAGQSLKRYANAFGLAKNVFPLIPGLPAILGPIISTLGKDVANQLGDVLSANFDAENMDIQTQKERVIDTLAEQKEKVLIVIDDIDRLSSEQIRQVFQLVASVARFPNTVYLLSFDYGVVVKALEEVQGGDGNDYLKKVIQVPIEVPEISADKVQDVLQKRIDDLMLVYNIKSLNQEHWFNIYHYCVEPFVGDLRDVNRLCNLLRIKLTNISQDIDFADMIGLTTIELFCPPVYNWIKNNRYRFVNKFPFLTGFNYDKRPKKEQWIAELKQLLDLSNCSQDKYDENAYYKCVSSLFPQVHEISYLVESTARRRNYVCHPEKVDRYFQLSIGDSAISVKELYQALNIFKSAQLVDMIQQFASNGKIIDFFREISAHKSDIEPIRAELLFDAMIKSAQNFSKHNDSMGLPPYFHARYITAELTECFSPERRVPYLCKYMTQISALELSAFADVFKYLENTHGRLTDKPSEKDFISLDDFEKLEQEFVRCLQRISCDNNLLDLDAGTLLLNLYHSFDEGAYSIYAQKLFAVSSNIIKMLFLTTSKWTSGGSEVSTYEINDHYLSYCTKNDLQNAIDCVIASGDLFSYDPDMQRVVAAYLITEHRQELSMTLDFRITPKLADAFLAWLHSSTSPICYSDFTYKAV